MRRFSPYCSSCFILTALMLVAGLAVRSYSQSVVVDASMVPPHGGTAVAMDRQGNIFVVDGTNNTVDRFDARLTLTKSIGGSGWGDYEFDSPGNVWCSFVLETFITDRNNRRIQEYDRHLNYVRTIDEGTVKQLPGRFFPLACAVTSRGDLFIVESDGNRIVKIDQRDNFLLEFGTYRDGRGRIISPSGIAVTDDDRIAVLDGAQVKMYDQYGNYLRSHTLPAGMDWLNIHSARDTIIVNSASTILLMNSEGETLSSIARSAIVGLETDSEIRDAALSPSSLIVLTTKELARCSFR